MTGVSRSHRPRLLITVLLTLASTIAELVRPNHWSRLSPQSQHFRRASVELAKLRTARVQAVQESLGGIRDVLLKHSQPVFYEKVHAVEDRVRRNIFLSAFLQLAPRAIVEGAAVALIAGFAIWFSAQPGGLLAAVPVLDALAIGAQRLLPMAQALYFGWASYATHAESIQDVFDLLEMPVGPEGPDGPVIPIPFERGLAMRSPSGTRTEPLRLPP